MKTFFHNTTQIICGENAVSNFGRFGEFGKRCIIVCGRSSARLCGALDDVTAALAKEGITATIFDKVEQNPTVETCHAGGVAARDFRADFVLGVGGGSPLDASKAIAAFATNPHLSPEALFDGEKSAAPLPIIAIPTTAGTGSEVTPYSILTFHKIANKKNFSSVDIYPRVALLDAAYTATLPQNVTAATAVDALSHAIEGYFSKRANPISDALAEKAMFLVGRGIRALNEGRLDSELREKLLIGSTLAGMVISAAGTSFVHSMGYPLTYFDGIPHGAANSYFLADYVEYLSLVSPDKAGKVYRLCGVRDGEAFAEMIEKACPHERRFDREVAMKYARIGAEGASAKNSVFEPDVSDVYNMIKKYII